MYSCCIQMYIKKIFRRKKSMLKFKEYVYEEDIIVNNNYVLAGDIGGTNANFGLCACIKNKIVLYASFHYKSKEVDQFITIVNTVLAHIKNTYGILLQRACFAAAGVISEKRKWVKPTNLSFCIDADELVKNTALTRIVLINDFEAVSWGVPYIDLKNLILVKEGKIRTKATKAIVGAGTGLGKSIMAWSEQYQQYTIIPSEGGHADFSVQDKNELDLVKFIQKDLNNACRISWEHVISGDGITRLYKFLETQKKYQKSDIQKTIMHNGYHPDKIFSYWQQDQHCKDTFVWYAALYGACAKNFALDALALAGVYIAGGIASKNISLFNQPGFLQSFINCGKQEALLQNIPIWVIADYNVSLYGAAAYIFFVQN